MYRRLSAARRAGLHARVAAAYERLNPADLEDQAEAIAHHWIHSHEPGRAVPHLVVAGQRAAARYANQAAVDAYRRALDYLTRRVTGAPDWPEERVAEIWEDLGDAAALGGDSATARHAYTNAAAAAPRAISPRRKAAHQALLDGDLPVADNMLSEAAQLLASESEPERLRLITLRAQYQWLSHQFDAAVATATEAAAVAESSGTDEDRARAYETMALVCLPVGDWRRGLEFERRRVELAVPQRHIPDVGDIHV
jgi:hypothetical protein